MKEAKPINLSTATSRINLLSVHLLSLDTKGFRYYINATNTEITLRKLPELFFPRRISMLWGKLYGKSIEGIFCNTQDYKNWEASIIAARGMLTNLARKEISSEAARDVMVHLLQLSKAKYDAVVAEDNSLDTAGEHDITASNAISGIWQEQTGQELGDYFVEQSDYNGWLSALTRLRCDSGYQMSVNPANTNVGMYTVEASTNATQPSPAPAAHPAPHKDKGCTIS